MIRGRITVDIYPGFILALGLVHVVVAVKIEFRF